MKFYEQSIKELIQQKEHMFGNLGRSRIVFEKALSFTRDGTVKKVIADVLIFSEKRDLIGIEIKTEMDSTKRLLRQLRSYSVSCDYVYIACHDKHVPEIEKIIKRHQFHHVGIIAYTAINDTLMAGMYKEAVHSPTKSVYHTVNMLWKKEIIVLLSAWKNPAKTYAREANLQYNKSISESGQYKTNSYTYRMSKDSLIKELIFRHGAAEANRMLCEVFINNRLDIDRVVKLHHFEKRKVDDNNAKG